MGVENTAEVTFTLTAANELMRSGEKQDPGNGPE